MLLCGVVDYDIIYSWVVSEKADLWNYTFRQVAYEDYDEKRAEDRASWDTLYDRYLVWCVTID